MQSSLRLKVLLIIVGIIGVGIGGAILLVPAEFHVTGGIVIGRDENLLSEMRAAGGALFACALIILAGAFLSRLTFTALVLSTALYLSYGASRLVGMALDGLPSANLMAVTAFELGVGLVCAFALATSKSSSHPDGNATA